MKALKIAGAIVGVVLLLTAASAIYVKTALPDVGEPEPLTIERTTARVERGRYLAANVAVCLDCHSTRRWEAYAAPMDSVGVGGGGEVFNRDMGFPGEFYAPNITPYALGDWTDGEILRAVSTGVSKDGHALFPVMASHRFGKMDKEDLYSIIAYIRTLEPVKKVVPGSEADFPVNILINTMPQKAQFQKRPSEENTVQYGAYLVNVAGCVDCHSQTDKGSIVAGTEFGGGMEFKQPGGIARSSNITSDPKTGIGSWTKEMFVQRFKAFADTTAEQRDKRLRTALPKDRLNTPMPWTMYAGMKHSDLEAIYAYLRTVKPISNQVTRFE